MHFTKYLVVNTLARALSAIRTVLFLLLFGMNHDLGVALYLISMIGQALVFGSIFDIIACKWSFAGDNRRRLNAMAVGFFVTSVAVFAILTAVSNTELVSLDLRTATTCLLVLSSMYLFGYEVTRARSVGENIRIAYAQAIVSLGFLAVFLPLAAALEEDAILPAMAISNLIGFAALALQRARAARLARADPVAPPAAETGLTADFLKSAAIYFLFSLLQTVDKVSGSYLFGETDLAGYLIGFSFLMMLRASVNVEQYFAARLRTAGTEVEIAARSIQIIGLFTVSILLLEDLIATIIQLIGNLEDQEVDVFIGSFRVLILAWLILTFVAVLNRTRIADVSYGRIVAGALIAGGIWIFPLWLQLESVVAVAFTLVISIALFAGIVFARYVSAMARVEILGVFGLLAVALGYAFVQTPLWLDLTVFLIFATGVRYVVSTQRKHA